MLSGLYLPENDLELTSVELGASGTGRTVVGYLLGREVAVKLLPLPVPPAACEALVREVRLLARLTASCRHTAKLLGLSVKEGRLALVMRSYPATLAQHLERQPGGCLPPGRALLLAAGLLRCLAELHAHGAVAAELRPDSVALDGAGEPLLRDFQIGGGESAAPGARGDGASPAVSLPYMAPEQFAVGEGDNVTPQSDMWAFAATMLHALTGAPPWAGLNIGQITMQVGVCRRSPKLPSCLPPGHALRDLLAACLRPDPRDRPSAAAALEAVQGELERRLERSEGEGQAAASERVAAAAAEAGPSRPPTATVLQPQTQAPLQLQPALPRQLEQQPQLPWLRPAEPAQQQQPQQQLPGPSQPLLLPAPAPLPQAAQQPQAPKGQPEPQPEQPQLQVRKRKNRPNRRRRAVARQRVSEAAGAAGEDGSHSSGDSSTDSDEGQVGSGPTAPARRGPRPEARAYPSAHTAAALEAVRGELERRQEQGQGEGQAAASERVAAEAEASKPPIAAVLQPQPQAPPQLQPPAQQQQVQQLRQQEQQRQLPPPAQLAQQQQPQQQQPRPSQLLLLPAPAPLPQAAPRPQAPKGQPEPQPGQPQLQVRKRKSRRIRQREAVARKRVLAAAGAAGADGSHSSGDSGTDSDEGQAGSPRDAPARRGPQPEARAYPSVRTHVQAQAHTHPRAQPPSSTQEYRSNRGWPQGPYPGQQWPAPAAYTPAYAPAPGYSGDRGHAYPAAAAYPQWGGAPFQPSFPPVPPHLYRGEPSPPAPHPRAYR